MKKIISFSSNDNRFFLEDCQFTPPLNVHFVDTARNPLLMRLSKTRLFAKNVLYYYLMAKNKLKKVANNSLAKSLEKRKAKKPPQLKKVFNFDSLVKKLHQLIESFPDPRTGKKIKRWGQVFYLPSTPTHTSTHLQVRVLEKRVLFRK
jgi:hypothetical protein